MTIKECKTIEELKKNIPRPYDSELVFSFIDTAVQIERERIIRVIDEIIKLEEKQTTGLSNDLTTDITIRALVAVLEKIKLILFTPTKKEDDVCIWKRIPETNCFMSCDGHSWDVDEINNTVRFFTYCPYCKKRLDVKEDDNG